MLLGSRFFTVQKRLGESRTTNSKLTDYRMRASKSASETSRFAESQSVVAALPVVHSATLNSWPVTVAYACGIGEESPFLAVNDAIDAVFGAKWELDRLVLRILRPS